MTWRTAPPPKSVQQQGLQPHMSVEVNCNYKKVDEGGRGAKSRGKHSPQYQKVALYSYFCLSKEPDQFSHGHLGVGVILPAAWGFVTPQLS
jgi:hypothetical protein